MGAVATGMRSQHARDASSAGATAGDARTCDPAQRIHELTLGVAAAGDQLAATECGAGYRREKH